MYMVINGTVNSHVKNKREKALYFMSITTIWFQPISNLTLNRFHSNLGAWSVVAKKFFFENHD